MRNSPESQISLGEHFFIRDAEALKPLAAAVIDVKFVEDPEGVWQRAGLKRLGSPGTRFEFITSRRIDYGAYVNRDGRYTFLRIAVLPFEKLIKYFENGARERAEEFIKNNPGYGLIK